MESCHISVSILTRICEKYAEFFQSTDWVLWAVETLILDVVAEKIYGSKSILQVSVSTF